MMNYVGSISIIDRGDAPAKAVIDKNARSLAQRVADDTKEELDKVMDRVEVIYDSYETSTQALFDNPRGDSPNVEYVEDIKELEEVIKDTVKKKKYQQQVTIFIVGFQDVCSEKMQLLQQVNQFFLDNSKPDEELEEEKPEIDLDEVSTKVNESLNTAEELTKKLSDLNQDIIEWLVNWANTKASNKGKKRLEKNLENARNDANMLSEKLLSLQAETEEKEEKLQQLVKQLEGKTQEALRYKTAAEVAKRSAQDTESHTNTLQEELQKRDEKIQEMRQKLSRIEIDLSQSQFEKNMSERKLDTSQTTTKQKLQQLQEEVDTKKIAVSEAEHQMERLHREQMANVEQQHRKEMDALKQEHLEELAKLTDDLELSENNAKLLEKSLQDLFDDNDKLKSSLIERQLQETPGTLKIDEEGFSPLSSARSGKSIGELQAEEGEVPTTSRQESRPSTKDTKSSRKSSTDGKGKAPAKSPSRHPTKSEKSLGSKSQTKEYAEVSIQDEGGDHTVALVEKSNDPSRQPTRQSKAGLDTVQEDGSEFTSAFELDDDASWGSVPSDKVTGRFAQYRKISQLKIKDLEEQLNVTLTKTHRKVNSLKAQFNEHKSKWEAERKVLIDQVEQAHKLQTEAEKEADAAMIQLEEFINEQEKLEDEEETKRQEIVKSMSRPPTVQPTTPTVTGPQVVEGEAPEAQKEEPQQGETIQRESTDQELKNLMQQTDDAKSRAPTSTSITEDSPGSELAPWLSSYKDGGRKPSSSNSQTEPDLSSRLTSVVDAEIQNVVPVGEESSTVIQKSSQSMLAIEAGESTPHHSGGRKSGLSSKPSEERIEQPVCSRRSSRSGKPGEEGSQQRGSSRRSGRSSKPPKIVTTSHLEEEPEEFPEESEEISSGAESQLAPWLTPTAYKADKKPRSAKSRSQTLSTDTHETPDGAVPASRRSSRQRSRSRSPSLRSRKSMSRSPSRRKSTASVQLETEHQQLLKERSSVSRRKSTGMKELERASQGDEIDPHPADLSSRTGSGRQRSRSRSSMKKSSSSASRRPSTQARSGLVDRLTPEASAANREDETTEAEDEVAGAVAMTTKERTSSKPDYEADSSTEYEEDVGDGKNMLAAPDSRAPATRSWSHRSRRQEQKDSGIEQSEISDVPGAPIEKRQASARSRSARSARARSAQRSVAKLAEKTESLSTKEKIVSRPGSERQPSVNRRQSKSTVGKEKSSRLTSDSVPLDLDSDSEMGDEFEEELNFQVPPVHSTLPTSQSVEPITDDAKMSRASRKSSKRTRMSKYTDPVNDARSALRSRRSRFTPTSTILSERSGAHHGHMSGSPGRFLDDDEEEITPYSADRTTVSSTLKKNTMSEDSAKRATEGQQAQEMNSRGSGAISAPPAVEPDQAPGSKHGVKSDSKTATKSGHSRKSPPKQAFATPREFSDSEFTDEGLSDTDVEIDMDLAPTQSDALTSLKKMMTEDNLTLEQQKTLESMRSALRSISVDQALQDVQLERTVTIISLASQIARESVELGVLPDSMFHSFAKIDSRAMSVMTKPRSSMATPSVTGASAKSRKTVDKVDSRENSAKSVKIQEPEVAFTLVNEAGLKSAPRTPPAVQAAPKARTQRQDPVPVQKGSKRAPVAHPSSPPGSSSMANDLASTRSDPFSASLPRTLTSSEWRNLSDAGFEQEAPAGAKNVRPLTRSHGTQCDLQTTDLHGNALPSTTSANSGSRKKSRQVTKEEMLYGETSMDGAPPGDQTELDIMMMDESLPGSPRSSKLSDAKKSAGLSKPDRLTDKSLSFDYHGSIFSHYRYPNPTNQTPIKTPDTIIKGSCNKPQNGSKRKRNASRKFYVLSKFLTLDFESKKGRGTAYARQLSKSKISLETNKGSPNTDGVERLSVQGRQLSSDSRMSEETSLKGSRSESVSLKEYLGTSMLQEESRFPVPIGNPTRFTLPDKHKPIKSFSTWDFGKRDSVIKPDSDHLSKSLNLATTYGTSAALPRSKSDQGYHDGKPFPSNRTHDEIIQHLDTMSTDLTRYLQSRTEVIGRAHSYHGIQLPGNSNHDNTAVQNTDEITGKAKKSNQIKTVTMTDVGCSPVFNDTLTLTDTGCSPVTFDLLVPTSTQYDEADCCVDVRDTCVAEELSSENDNSLTVPQTEAHTEPLPQTPKTPKNPNRALSPNTQSPSISSSKGTPCPPSTASPVKPQPVSRQPSVSPAPSPMPRAVSISSVQPVVRQTPPPGQDKTTQTDSWSHIEVEPIKGKTEDEIRTTSARSRASLRNQFKTRLEETRMSVEDRRAKSPAISIPSQKSLDDDQLILEDDEDDMPIPDELKEEKGMYDSKEDTLEAGTSPPPGAKSPGTVPSHRTSVVSRQSVKLAEHPVVEEYLKTYSGVTNFKEAISRVLLDKDLMSASQVLADIEMLGFDQHSKVVPQLESMTENVYYVLNEVSTVINSILYNDRGPVVSSLMMGMSRDPTQRSMMREKSSETRASQRTISTKAPSGSAEKAQYRELQSQYEKLQGQLSEDSRKYEEQLRHNTVVMMEMQDTINELQRELSALGKTQRRPPSESLSTTGAGSQATESAVMFTRLDSDRNAKIMKKAVQDDKLSPDSYKEAVVQMDDYVNLPAQRLNHLVRKYVHHCRMKEIEENVKKSKSLNENVFDILDKMEALQNQRAKRWADRMDEMGIERLRLANLLMETLDTIEQESGIFLIKPMYSYRGREPKQHYTGKLSRPFRPQRALSPQRDIQSAYAPAPTPASNMRAVIRHQEKLGQIPQEVITTAQQEIPRPLNGDDTGLMGSSFAYPESQSKATWSMAASQPRISESFLNSSMNTPRILELDINRMMIGQNTISAKVPGGLSEDRLVNASQNNLRAYMTVNRPAASPGQGKTDRPRSHTGSRVQESPGSGPSSSQGHGSSSSKRVRLTESMEFPQNIPTTPPLPPINTANKGRQTPQSKQGRKSPGRESPRSPSASSLRQTPPQHRDTDMMISPVK